MLKDSTKNSKRNEFIDIIKGFAIILVIIGHCIQYNYGNNIIGFFNNSVVKFIYSFHMPLLMLVSGYLFYFSFKKHSFKENLKNRFFTLFIPIVFCSTLNFLIKVLIKEIVFSGLFSILKAFVLTLIESYWYLWALLILSLFVLIVDTYFKKFFNVIYITAFIISFFVPYFNIYIFMYLYFLIGYSANKYKISNVINNKLEYLILCVFVFVIMLYFYNKDMYIYTTNIFIIKDGKIDLYQFIIDAYRYLIGLFGSLSCIGILKRISKYFNMKLLTLSGKNSLGLYVFSTLIIGYVFKFISFFDGRISILIVMLQFLIIFLINLCIIYFIKKIPLLNKLILGGR